MVGGHWIDSGGMAQDLNSLIPAKSGYQITYATAIKRQRPDRRRRLRHH
jgi:hypothetical protein